MSEIILAIVQTSIVSGILAYVGKTILDRLVKRSQELEDLKTRTIENNVSRVEKANERFGTEVKDLAKKIDDLKFTVVKVQHVLEANKEKVEATNEELQRFVSYADKVIRDVESSQIIEISKKLQILLVKGKKQP